VTSAVVVPLAYTTISPRIDYQLSTNNTLTVRFEERFNSHDNRSGRHAPAGAVYQRHGLQHQQQWAEPDDHLRIRF
jgi:hypothetical protein